jgi:adenylate cyclase class IV
VSGGHDELELKARVSDPAALERALEAAGAEVVFRGEMLDTRYDRRDKLAQRDEVLRVREFRPAAGGLPFGVLGWKGPATRRDGYKHREEHETRCDDPAAVAVILGRLGYEVTMRIDRTVTEYRLGGAAVRLEWYPEMDVLVEVEGEPAAIERAVAATGLARDAFLAEPLPHFVAAYERRTGRRARIAAADR